MMSPKGVEMATDLCSEDVVVQMAPQATITGVPEGVVSVVGVGPGLAAAGAGAGIRGGVVGAMELGRRLLLAARVGDTALVLDLMAKGAPFTTDWLGTSPLHLAASNDHADTCGVLLRAGVSRDSRTKVERTPLHLAAAAGHTSVVALLLRHGAAADARDLLRMTPLHWAAQRGHAEVAQALLKYGADPNAVSKFNKTPTLLAARAGHTDVLKLLEDAVRLRETAKYVKVAHVAEPLDEEPFEQPQQQQKTKTHATIRKIVPEIRTTIEVPDNIHVKVTKQKQNQEKLSKSEEKEKSEIVEDITEESVDLTEGVEDTNSGGAAAILRRHGITLLPPDTGGTVLSALQSGRTVVLSDAGKLMLQESVPARAAPRPPAAPHAAPHAAPARPSPPQTVKLIQLPAEARAAVRRVATSAPTTVGKPRPPVKIIMNKSNFERLVAGVQKPTKVTAVETPITVADDSTDEEVTLLRAQLTASQRTVARLTEELKFCRAKLAQYEGQ